MSDEIGKLFDDLCRQWLIKHEPNETYVGYAKHIFIGVPVAVIKAKSGESFAVPVMGLMAYE
jgi:hypothetical protein